MKTSTTHGYHGITHREDAWGWVIQIRLLGTYRVIKTYAADAETAARRHDVALNKLRAFVDARAEPNFSEDFPPQVDANAAPKDYHTFYNELTNLFHGLVGELESTGQNYDDVDAARAEQIQRNIETSKQAAALKRSAALTALLRLQDKVRNLGLPMCDQTAANSYFDGLQRILK